ncbi:MAG TPA: hypothetical protein VLM38_16590, partial [Blastocatellia bacterium]|nr:hypothetical protein [Blastocatellia bacterium]
MKTRSVLVSILAGMLSLLAAFPFSQASPVVSQPQPARFQAGASAAPSGDSRLETRFIATETAGTLFENVARVLEKKFYDQRFRTDALPKLLAQFSEKARRASTLREQREVTEEFLSHIPASHLGLVSKTTHRYVMYDLEGRQYPTFGFQLIEINSRYYAFTVLEGGP